MAVPTVIAVLPFLLQITNKGRFSLSVKEFHHYKAVRGSRNRSPGMQELLLFWFRPYLEDIPPSQTGPANSYS